MLNLCSTCAQLITQSTQVFGYPGPITRQQRSFSLLFFLWLIAYEKQRVLIFPQDPYRNQRLLPFFSLELICVYAKMDFCYQCTMHTLVVCSLNYFHASIIFGKGGCCGFIMLWVSSPLCLYICLKSSWVFMMPQYFKPCICNQKWNWICQYVYELTR